MTTTEQSLPVECVEQIWEHAASHMDIDPELNAVVVICHQTLGYITSGTYLSMPSAKQGLKRHAAKRYATCAYLVVRGQGESFAIIRKAGTGDHFVRIETA